MLNNKSMFILTANHKNPSLMICNAVKISKLAAIYEKTK